MPEIKLAVHGKHGKHAIHAVRGRKYLWSAVGLLSAAAVSGSLIAVAAGPAGTAVRPPTAPIISVSGDGRSAVAVRDVLDRVRRTSDGQLVLAAKGLGRQARRADSAFVADLNKLDRQAGAVGLAGGNVVEAAATVPAARHHATVVEVLPGVTLTIARTRVVLDISAQDVAVVLDVAAVGSAVAAFVGGILAVIPDTALGGAIAGLISSSINLGSSLVRVCSGLDGGSIVLSVSTPRGKLPSVSACGVTI